ncbi:MAG: substrate-binding domain-containing protein [Clostridia bacterium]|nr:substrate-binding domain-containing protein [Clostridia bacterium]
MDCFVMCEYASDTEAKKAILSQYMNGIKQQLRTSRHRLREIDETQIPEVIEYFEKIQKRPVVIIVSLSAMWLENCLDILHSFNVYALLLTPTADSPIYKNTSTVSFDEGEAVNTLCRYFAQNGIQRVAYFGYDPNTPAHGVQYNAFKKCKTRFNFQDIHPYFDCYSNYGNIDKCARVFFSRYEDYEAVICSNPDCAVKLLHDMKALGIKENRLHIASVGSSELSNAITPKITSYNFDSALCGQKVVKLYKTLVNNPEISVLSARTSGTLSINESTGFMPFNNTATFSPHQAFTLVHPTYIISGDDEIDTITRIENLLCRSDVIDREYIELLINGKETKDFAEKHFISENTLNYRIKNMCKTLGVSSRKELQKTLVAWMT